MKSTSRILICGDTVPDRRATEQFIKGNVKEIYGDLLQDMKDADTVVLNLECPLIREEDPKTKTGPVLGVTDRSIEGLSVADVLNLANNHIMDHGAAGLLNTIKTCRSSGLNHVGAGRNLAEAQAILIRENGGTRMGICSMAEHEFSIASFGSAGANPLEITDFVRLMKAHADEWDFLIVLLHAGIEYYPYPSPRLRDTCRFMVEEGASAVICQHSHCVGSYERYGNGHIVYGQGNFIFDRFPGCGSSWHEGIVVDLTVESDGNSEIRFIPYEQYTETPEIRRMNSESAGSFLEKFEQRSKNLETDGFVERKWEEFCKDEERSYLGMLMLPPGRAYNYLNTRFDIARKLGSKARFRYLLNLIRCESHRDVLPNILERIHRSGGG